MFAAKRVFVVYPSPQLKKDARFGYSIECLSLATVIKSEGFATSYFDFSLNVLENDLVRQVGYEPECSIVVLYLDSVPLHRSSNVENGLALISRLRREVPAAKIIACGPWCMCSSSDVAGSDETWHGEPEYCFYTAISKLHPRAEKTSIALLADLGKLPIPDRSFLPDLRIIEHQYGLERSAVVQTTRGCSNGCLFCPRQAWTARLVRHRRIEDCANEVISLVSSGVRNIWIDDDNMGADPNWSSAFFDAVAQRRTGLGDYGIYFSTDVNVDGGIFSRAHRAGARIVSFGIESAAVGVRRYFHKATSDSNIRKAVCQADKAGLFTVGNFIVGAPVESEADIRQTCQLIRELPFDEINVKILSVVQGAPLWKECVRKGFLAGDSICEFACRETGVSKFSMAELRERQKIVYDTFRADERNRVRLALKIRAFGMPYFMMNDGECV